MVTKYKFAEDIKEQSKELIATIDNLKHIDIEKVVFCRINKHLSGDHVLGQIAFMSDRTQFLTGKKYVIEFPPVFDTLNEQQQNIVIEHELSHIPVEEVGLIPHDIGEFRAIINKYGIDWINTMAESEEKVKLIKQKEKLEKKLQKSKEDK